ncbi:Hypp6201 [Branchiostoma lanceolatum]|uniref:Hypp6201 protein n=1 Tax=Branchiostoma lanceolatum TaxID=7740 RepID=A0A8J9W0W6_BRALA|nr:Hypp6201 [Branchiostoma lanceolatum]
MPQQWTAFSKSIEQSYTPQPRAAEIDQQQTWKTSHSRNKGGMGPSASRIPTCGSHEDIDQFLSRIATELQMRDAITVDELVDAISDSFPNTEVEEVKAMLDVKEFLANGFASDENWKSPRNDEVRLVDRLPPANAKPKLVVPRLERLELDQFQSGFLKDPSKTLQQQGLVKQLHGSEEDPRATRQESVLPTAFDNTLSNGS